MRHVLPAVTTRRQLLETALGAAAAACFPRWAESASPRTRLILLGTGGGPRPRTGSMATSQVIIAHERLYVVDCGDGVARQLVNAGASLTGLRHVFITHHHSDHNADYGNLLLLSWAAGLHTRVDTWGPPPLGEITRLFFEMSATDIDVRVADEGRVPLVPLVHAHELVETGHVLQDELVKVRCAVVDHPMVQSALAYRFDAADRSIVISGDTRPCDSLVALAHGADVLVHEAFYPSAADRLARRVGNASTLKKHLLASHTAVEDCGRVASAARVKTLVLSHFVPPDDPAITENMWREAAARHFTGEIVIGRDLMEI